MIRLPDVPAKHSRSPYISERSKASADPQGWLNRLRQTNTIHECEAIRRNAEAEAYASQWKLVA